MMQLQISEKLAVAELLAQLPEDSTLEDIQYHLYVLEKIKHGQADVAMGKTYTQAEVGAKLQKWL
jgi:predicted transcriptional regulator